MSLNTDDRARLRQALEKATEAPWHAAITPHPAAVKARKEGVGLYGPDCLIYSMARDYGCLPETFARQQADAELIALMRNTLPALLDRLDALEGERDRLVSALDAAMCPDCDQIVGSATHSPDCPRPQREAEATPTRAAWLAATIKAVRDGMDDEPLHARDGMFRAISVIERLAQSGGLS